MKKDYSIDNSDIVIDNGAIQIVNPSYYSSISIWKDGDNVCFMRRTAS